MSPSRVRRVASFVAPATLLAAVGAWVALSAPDAPRASAETSTWEVDGVHSFVLFKNKHLQVASIHGRFDGISGKIELDEQDATKSKLEVVIDAASVSSGNSKRDDHIRNPDFLNAAQFPTITFKSTSITKVDDKHFEVNGDLTLHGVTKPVKATMEKGGPVDHPRGGRVVGFEGSFTVKRGDFGITKYLDPTNEDVTMTLSIEATKK
jgi:polyisoprenoid-binding protein YceI